MNRNIVIDAEFRDLLPPLTKEEMENLESLIVKDGCTSPLIVWGDILADGHNRYEICTRLGIHYQVNFLDRPDRDSVMLWMLENQGGRRNLSDLSRISIARKKEVILARRAKERQSDHGGTAPGKPKNTSGEIAISVAPGLTTRAEAAKAAGVGEKKYAEGKLILEAVENGEAPKEVIEKIEAGELSIHRAATEIKEARKPAEEPGQPQAEFIAPAQRPAKIEKYVPDLTGQFLPLVFIHIDKISSKDVQFKSAMEQIIQYCQSRLNKI